MDELRQGMAADLSQLSGSRAAVAIRPPDLYGSKQLQIRPNENLIIKRNSAVK